MQRYCFLLMMSVLVTACATAPREAAPDKRNTMADSVTRMDDGLIEIFVTGQVVLPKGTDSTSINMRELLEEAAAAECAPEGFELISYGGAGMETPKTTAQKLKLRYKGVIRCR